jgi:hypothetical protein
MPLLDINNYSPEAIETARSGAIVDLSTNFLLIKLIDDLTRQDLRAAQTIFAQIERRPPVGFQLYQFRTAALMLTRAQQDRAAFRAALDLWLAGRTAYPINWSDAPLRDTALVDWIDVDTLPIVAAPKPTAQDPADAMWVAAATPFITQAIEENITWLREMNIHQPVTALASLYKIVHVNAYLREVTIRAEQDEIPDIIIALQPDRSFAGSFLAH